MSLDVLASESFLQGLFLLVATAGLTGLLVPTIKGRLDDRKYREQKIFDAEIARQSKVIDAQAQLLDDLSHLLWGFLLLSLEVTYYAQQGNREKFDAAWRQYDDEGWTYFTKIRAEISKARHLTSPEIHDELLDVYARWFPALDFDLAAMARTDTPLEQTGWDDLHARIAREGAKLVEDVLNDLAEELRLTQRASAAPTR
jgi:hypothetical protein